MPSAESWCCRPPYLLLDLVCAWLVWGDWTGPAQILYRQTAPALTREGGQCSLDAVVGGGLGIFFLVSVRIFKEAIEFLSVRVVSGTWYTVLPSVGTMLLSGRLQGSIKLYNFIQYAYV